MADPFLALRSNGIRTRIVPREEIREWTIKRLWDEYIRIKPQTKGFVVDGQRFKNHIEPLLGNKRLEDLAPLDLDRLRANMLQTFANRVRLDRVDVHLTAAKAANSLRQSINPALFRESLLEHIGEFLHGGLCPALNLTAAACLPGHFHPATDD